MAELKTTNDVFEKDYDNILKDWERLKNIEVKYGLHLEVLLFAIKNIREDSSLTFSEALDLGMDEWDV